MLVEGMQLLVSLVGFVRSSVCLEQLFRSPLPLICVMHIIKAVLTQSVSRVLLLAYCNLF